MKVILLANISANGKILLSENLNHQVPMEIIEASAAIIRSYGNLIMGRKSFEVFEQAMGGADRLKAAYPGVDLVWLSQSLAPTEDKIVASSPEAALAYLAQRSHETMLVGGGTQVYNAFLKADLVTDFIFHVAPIISPGADFLPQHIPLRLSEYRKLSADTLQVVYQKNHHSSRR
jgi:Dihydrofolate reductase